MRVRIPQVKGTHRSMVVRIPNSRGQPKAWESVSATQGATPKHEKERKKDERKNTAPAFAPKIVSNCIWAGVLLQMNNHHFHTNEICLGLRPGAGEHRFDQANTFLVKVVCCYYGVVYHLPGYLQYDQPLTTHLPKLHPR